MGLFESNPWLLIPIIIVTVEGWFALKTLISSWRHSRNNIGLKQ